MNQIPWTYKFGCNTVSETTFICRERRCRCLTLCTCCASATSNTRRNPVYEVGYTVLFLTFALQQKSINWIRCCRERRCRCLALCMCCSTRMAGNRGGPGVQGDQPDPLGRMSELFAQVSYCCTAFVLLSCCIFSHAVMFLSIVVTEVLTDPLGRMSEPFAQVSSSSKWCVPNSVSSGWVKIEFAVILSQQVEGISQDPNARMSELFAQVSYCFSIKMVLGTEVPLMMPDTVRFPWLSFLVLAKMARHRHCRSQSLSVFKDRG